MSKSLAERAFDLSYAQLRAQKEDLKFLRNQASICAAVSGLVASVFANLVKASDQAAFEGALVGLLGFSIMELMTLLLFASSIGLAVMAVINWKKCIFDLNCDTIMHAKEYKRDEDDLFSQLASDSKKYFEENEKVLDDTKQKLTWSLVFAWAQIPSWVTLLS